MSDLITGDFPCPFEEETPTDDGYCPGCDRYHPKGRSISAAIAVVEAAGYKVVKVDEAADPPDCIDCAAQCNAAGSSLTGAWDCFVEAK